MKKAIYNVFNGESYDEIAFKTLAAQVICRNDLTLEELIEKTPIMGLNIGRYDKFGDIGFPYVAQDGVMEVGKFIDMHSSDGDYTVRLEALAGVLKFWQDISGLNVWARKYLRINDWYGGNQDGRFYYKQENKGMYTENVEDFYVQGNAVARGKNERMGNADIYHLGGGLRLVRQVIKTSAANSGGGVSYTIHFPKAWNWVQPISLVSHNENNTAYNTSGYCTIDTWSTTYLNGGCYQMVAGKPTQIILTYLAG